MVAMRPRLRSGLRPAPMRCNWSACQESSRIPSSDLMSMNRPGHGAFRRVPDVRRESRRARPGPPRRRRCGCGGTAQTDDVALTGMHRVVHRGAGTEAAGDRQRDITGKAAHRAGVLQEVGLARSGAVGGLAHHGGLLVAAAADLDHVDALIRQCRHHGAGFIFGEPAALEVDRVELIPTAKLGDTRAADVALHLEHKTHPTLRVTAHSSLRWFDNGDKNCATRYP